MGCITLGNRQMMIQVIKTIIEPYLRAHGFKGSYPHKVKVYDLKADERFVVGSDLGEPPDSDGKSFVLKGLTTEQEHEYLAREAVTYLNIEDSSWIKSTVSWHRVLYQSFDEEE